MLYKTLHRNLKSEINPTEIRGEFGKQFLLHVWHLSFYSFFFFSSKQKITCLLQTWW